ncbi:MAG: RNA polymerase Rpb6 [Bacteroidetes bacterium]|nr:MAG: RNA polymerase Rpb6 [Bacteroidota bacterium]
MDIKKLEAPTTTVTRDLIELEKPTGNIYESIAIISKRAEQISVQLKEELMEKINEFSSNLDSLDEIFENREQIELSKYYERLPKPTLLAIQEFLEGKTYFRKPEEEELN